MKEFATALTLNAKGQPVEGSMQLPTSKSESNRWLVLQALSKGNIEIVGLSQARDTQLLQEALKSDSLLLDVKDAGTTMRFLTAYFCATRQHKMLTGSPRMNERPIGTLVEALMQLGFRINYLRQAGYPPLEMIPVNEQKTLQDVTLDGTISSQYISALLLIAPTLPKVCGEMRLPTPKIFWKTLSEKCL